MTHCVILCDVSGHSYGQRVVRRRTELDMSVRHAAELAGVSVTGWNDIERGGELRGGGIRPTRKRPYRKTVLKMAKALGWPPADALRWAGYNEPGTDVVGVPGTKLFVRAQLVRLLDVLSEPQVQALLYVAMTMTEPQAPVPPGLGHNIPGVTPPPIEPPTAHRAGEINTPQEADDTDDEDPERASSNDVNPS